MPPVSRVKEGAQECEQGGAALMRSETEALQPHGGDTMRVGSTKQYGTFDTAGTGVVDLEFCTFVFAQFYTTGG